MKKKSIFLAALIVFGLFVGVSQEAYAGVDCDANLSGSFFITNMTSSHILPTISQGNISQAKILLQGNSNTFSCVDIEFQRAEVVVGSTRVIIPLNQVFDSLQLSNTAAPQYLSIPFNPAVPVSSIKTVKFFYRYHRNSLNESWVTGQTYDLPIPFNGGQAVASGGVQNTDPGGVPQGGVQNTATSPSDVLVKLQNPLRAAGISSIPDFIKQLFEVVIAIGVPAVALAIIYSGFLLVSARGNPAELEKAKKTLLWSILGGAILLGAYVIAQFIGGTVDQIRGA